MQPPRASPAMPSWDDYSAHLCPCRQNFPPAPTFSGKSTFNYPICSYIREWWIALVALVVLGVIWFLRKLPWVSGELRWCVLDQEQAIIRVCCWNIIDWDPVALQSIMSATNTASKDCCGVQTKQKLFKIQKQQGKKNQLPSTLHSSDIKTILLSIKT